MAAQATEPSAPPEKPADGEPVIGGLRGLLYIAVQAALNEGFSEEEVFAHEKLSPEAWQRGDEAWAAALADSAETDSKLFDNYDATYNAYKWAFHRVIEPLESDVDAWMLFNARLNESEDQDAFLEEQGIDQNDVLRLQELWSARLANDPTVRERMLEGPKTTELPPLHVPPKVLPPPVNKEPIPAPPGEAEAEAEEAPEKRPPPPPLLAVLPAFPKGAAGGGVSGAPGAAVSGAPPGTQSARPAGASASPPAAPSATPVSPPPEEFGFYVPPPVVVRTPSVPSPSPVAPAPVVHNVAPPAMVSSQGQARTPDWQRSPPPQLSMADYTSAVAEIQAYPGAESRVAGKYGMTAEGFAKERVAWDNQLAQMPNLRPEFADRLGRAVAHWQALARRR